MARRLDEIFDPGALEERWARKPEPSAEEAPRAARPLPPPLALIARIEAVLRRDLRGAEKPVLPLLARARALVGATLPGDDGKPPDPKAAKDARAELDRLLDDIEDLVEAAEVGRR